MEFEDDLSDAKVVYNYVENRKHVRNNSDIADMEIDPLVRLKNALVYLEQNGFSIATGKNNKNLFVVKNQSAFIMCKLLVIDSI